MKSGPRGRFKWTRRAGRRFVAAFVGSLSLLAGLSADENLTESLYWLVLQHSQIAAEMDAGVAATGLSASASRVESVDAAEGDLGDRLAAIRETIAHVAKAIPPVEFPLIEEIEIPLAASDDAEEFLFQHACLQNERALIVNAMRGELPEARQRALDEWESRTQARRASQLVLGFELGRQPSLLAVQPEWDREMEEFLRQEQARLDERARVAHEVRHLSAAEQQVALQQWEQRNAPRAETTRP